MITELFIGDIVYAPADVVCTSTNPHLELILGTGGAIRTAGGWSIQEECSDQIASEREKSGRNWLEPGRAVITGAGVLPFRAVIHCVAIDAFHDSSAEVVQACVRNALELVAEQWGDDPVRLALPVFASGHGHLDYETSLRTITSELGSRPRPGIRSIIIVEREESRKTLAERVLNEVYGKILVRVTEGNS